MDRLSIAIVGFTVGIWTVIIVTILNPQEPEVKYIYDDSIGHDAASEARLVGFCNGKYLIRTEEDEFPEGSCMFIEPITWKD